MPAHTVHDARAEYERRSAYRAIDDPAALARAARIVRAALARQKIALADLTPLEPPKDKSA